MDLNQGEGSAARFAAYVAGLGSVIGPAVRMKPLRDYCTGLMLPGERKSVEPIAARTAPARTAAQHQSLLHFVGNATWSDADVLAKVREMVLPAIDEARADRGVDHDDTSPEAGKHPAFTTSNCGPLGKPAIAKWRCPCRARPDATRLPVANRLFLPDTWAKDRARRKKAGVPKKIKFRTKPEIALEQIRWVFFFFFAFDLGYNRRHDHFGDQPACDLMSIRCGSSCPTDARSAFQSPGFRGCCGRRRPNVSRSKSAAQACTGKPSTKTSRSRAC